MKVTFLGTAAAEGFPAVFCNCRFCKEARILGGKNLRTRSQSLVNDDLLIDLPADTYHHFLMNGIEGHKIKYLFVTHPHQDHFYPEELNMRGGCYSHDMEAPMLQMFCDRETAEAAMAEAGNHAKTAITMILADCSAEEARERLKNAGGHVRQAIR